MGASIAEDTVPSPDAIEILLIGYIPSKKNLYKRAGFTHGRRGMYKDQSVVACLDSLAAQIPQAYLGLKLEHPRVSWQFTVPAARQDRDNMKTAVLDILVKAGVLANDNIARYNGLETIHPAIVDPSQEPSVLVRLRPAREKKKAVDRRKAA